jgi:hypothetical protein
MEAAALDIAFAAGLFGLARRTPDVIEARRARSKSARQTCEFACPGMLQGRVGWPQIRPCLVGRREFSEGALRIVETVGAVLASLIAVAMGFFAGRRWVSNAYLGALFGVPLGIVSATLYFTLALLIARAWPRLLDAHLVGLCVLAVLVVGTACAAAGAVFGYRKSLGVRLF